MDEMNQSVPAGSAAENLIETMMRTAQENLQVDEERLERMQGICNRIWSASRTELFYSLRFLDIPLSAFRFGPSGKTMRYGTDGEIIYYSPDHIIHEYRRQPALITRGYLHMVFHCLFRHPWKEIPELGDEIHPGQGGSEDTKEQALKNSEKENREYFDLACNIAVEYLIDSLDIRAVKLPVNGLRRQVYDLCFETLTVLTAEGVYHVLKHANLTQRELASMIIEFEADDHGFWKRESQSPDAKRQKNRWDENSDKTQTGMETISRQAGEQFGDMLQVLKVENRTRYDYGEFLKKFAVMREEVAIDEDTFDPIAYTYGLEHYGNVPLIEPLETKETKRIEEFVIVIDTSLSTKDNLVEKYLQETYGILEDSESFFRKINLHIIQCDKEVQSDVKITSREELEEYMEHFSLKGGGGTDFRPAFAHVAELMRQGAFERLRGMLFFTDGYGEYPAKRPPYEVAFLFLTEDGDEVPVPPWAMKIVLGET